MAGRCHRNLPKMKRRLAILSLCFLPALAFSQEPKKDAEPVAAAAEKSPKVRFKTNLGTFVVELNTEKAPVTVENFLSYVNKKHYDGTVFHRVIDGFMIQGGGFGLEGARIVEKPTGKGIVNEGRNGLKNDRGTIAMARTNDPNSATAQFFINVKDNAMLNFPSNGGYAVFGKVIEGMDVVDKIKDVETGEANITMRHPATGQKMDMPSDDVPKKNVVIESATAE